MNALWLQELVAFSVQTAAVIAAGALALALGRVRSPRERLHLWQGVLLLAIILPFTRAAFLPASDISTRMTVAAAAGSSTGSRAISLAPILLWTVVAGIVLRGCWLLLGACRLVLLRRASQPLTTISPCIAALSKRIGVSAEVRISHDVDAPVAVGVARPLILVPPRFETQAPDVQAAVICHELIHVRRRDWLATLVEEAIASALWFHPLVRFAISNIRLLREATVDRQAIQVTRERKAYLRALLLFAEPPPRRVIGATAFLRGRQLTRRLTFIRQENVMSRRHFAVASTAAGIIVMLSSVAAAERFPLSLAVFQIEAATQAPPPPPAPPSPAAQDTKKTQSPPVVKDTKGTRKTTTSKDKPPPPPPPPPPAAVGPDAPPPPPPPPQRPPRDGVPGGVVGGLPAGVPGGVPGGVAGGVPGGVSGEAQMKSPTAFPDVARVGGDVTAPRIIRETKPHYTADAMRAKIQGSVKLEVLVLATGEVGGVEVAESLDREFGLDDEAVKAAWQWVFTPGTRDGTAVPVVVTLEMTFTLRK